MAVEALKAGAFAAVKSTGWADGGAGVVGVAEAVVKACAQPSSFKHLYDVNASIEDKILAIAKSYGADGVDYSAEAQAKLKLFTELGYDKMPICMAKTQYSFSTDPAAKGAPVDHTIEIREVRLSAGAEFIVAICGEIMTMPGLPKVPSAEAIGLNAAGEVVGLF